MQPSNQPSRGPRMMKKVELTDGLFRSYRYHDVYWTEPSSSPQNWEQEEDGMPLPMSRRIELLRTKWFNLLIHSSRQMERLPIVNERIGLAWNGEQALTGSAERTTTRGEPAFTPMLWPLVWPYLLHFLVQPLSFLRHSDPYSPLSVSYFPFELNPHLRLLQSDCIRRHNCIFNDFIT